MAHKELQSEIYNKLYDLNYGKISIKEFETWVYESNSLKSSLSDGAYLQLLELDYSIKAVKYEIDKILKEIIGRDTFEKIKLVRLLEEALSETDQLPNILSTFYDLYCHGYTFLFDLGMGYGLTCIVPPSNNYSANTWEELNKREQKEIIDSFYPKLTFDLKRVLNWINNKSIILTGEQDRFGKWVFEDNRSSEDQILNTVKQNTNSKGYGIKKKKWWKFWE